MPHRRSCACQTLIIVLACLVNGCVAPVSDKGYQKDGKTYGQTTGAFFRHRWWNYYERGLSYAEGRYYTEAAADLREALRQRSEDRRMARTYGMHFIDYFPHRELGIIFYETGALAAAQKELQRSLDQYPTAKARYYLDQVRKKIIEQSRIEAGPPALVLADRQGVIWTRDDPVLISGTAQSDRFVSRVTIAGSPLFQEGAQLQVSFSQPLQLAQGHHAIEVTATDLSGLTARKVLTVQVDRQGPMIVLEQIGVASGSGAGWMEIQGLLIDEAGVSALEVDGSEVPLGRGLAVPFRVTLPAGTEMIELTARDRIGNRNVAQFDWKKMTLLERRSVLLASAGSSWNSGLSVEPEASQTQQPVIRLNDWTASQTVFLPKVYLEGRVSDADQVVALQINRSAILKHPGRHVFFSQFLELQPGPNEILIEARNAAGNTAATKITIVRREPEALRLEARLKLTVLPFGKTGDVSEAGAAFQEYLINAFVNQSRFRVVERDLLDLILQEQRLSGTKLVDRSTALKVGRLVAAQSIIAGTIVESRNGIEIISRMVDTETSEVVATEDAFDEATDLPSLRALAEALAIKYHRDFPLVGGIVIDKKDRVIFTDLGQEELKCQRRVIVYTESEVRHPVTGKILGADKQIVSRARVTQVEAKMSKAELLDPSEPVEVLHKVVTE